jgi:hypothetical protein
VRSTRFCIAIVILAVSGARAEGQILGALDLGGGLGQPSAGPWLRESQFAPSLRVVHQTGFLQLDGAAVERAGALSLRRANAEAAVSSPAFGAFRFSASGKFDHDDALLATPTNASLTAAVSARVGRSGIWMGTTAGRGFSPDGNVDARSLNFGLWRVLGNAIVSISSRSPRTHSAPQRTYTISDSVWNDTTKTWNRWSYTYTDSSASARVHHWSELEARVDWSAGRLALQASISSRPRVDSATARTWGQLRAALQLNRHVSLVASGGTFPPVYDPRGASARFATLGLRLSPSMFLRPHLPATIRPAATAFAVQRVDSGQYRVVFRVPNARTVEISGDFNRWTPIELRQSAPNVWEATIAAPAGTHRVNVRVDGDRWSVPPGLPSVEDEFSGRVGLLVLR